MANFKNAVDKLIAIEVERLRLKLENSNLTDKEIELAQTESQSRITKIRYATNASVYNTISSSDASGLPSLMFSFIVPMKRNGS